MQKIVVLGILMLLLTQSGQSTPSTDYSTTVEDIVNILQSSAVYKGNLLLGWEYRINSTYQSSENIYNGYTVGGAGIGEFLVHAVAQGYNQSYDLLAELVNHYIKTASSGENGTWWSELAQEKTPPYTGSRYGASGIIRFLAESSNIFEFNTTILTDAAKWIFTTEDKSGNIPISPNSFYTSGREYGMTGIGEDLLVAYTSTGETVFLKYAEEIASKLETIARYGQGKYGEMASILWTAYGEGTQFEDLVIIGPDAGMAGVMSYFDKLYFATNNESYYEFADKVANYILEKDQGGFWYNTSVGYITKGRTTHGLLGYQSGSAGIATALLNHYFIKQNRDELLASAATVEKLLERELQPDMRIPAALGEDVYYSGVRQGTVGYGMYNLELYELLGAERYLEKAQEVAKYIDAILEQRGKFPVAFNSSRYGYSYNFEEGIAGAGEFLLRLMEVKAGTVNSKYEEFLQSAKPNSLVESSKTKSTPLIISQVLSSVFLLVLLKRRIVLKGFKH